MPPDPCPTIPGLLACPTVTAIPAAGLTSGDLTAVSSLVDVALGFVVVAGLVLLALTALSVFLMARDR